MTNLYYIILILLLLVLVVIIVFFIKEQLCKQNSSNKPSTTHLSRVKNYTKKVLNNSIIKNSENLKALDLGVYTKPVENPTYFNGVNLGGWLVIENFMFPNVPFLNNPYEPQTERSYIGYMVQNLGIESALLSMHNHWANFITNDDLIQLGKNGITRLRIPIGWWIFDAPLDNFVLGKTGITCAGMDDVKNNKNTMYQVGFQQNGFVTGGMLYLENLLKKCKLLGFKVLIDCHALPGGAQVNQGYAGDWFTKSEFWCGNNPCTNDYYFTRGREFILKTCQWIKHINNTPETSNVIFGIEPVNEPFTGMNQSLKDTLCGGPGSQSVFEFAKEHFYTNLVQDMRNALGTNDVTIIHSWLQKPDSIEDIQDIFGAAKDPNIMIDLHSYTAFNQCPWAPNMSCTSSTQCDELDACVRCCKKTNSVTVNDVSKNIYDNLFSETTKFGFDAIIGEWSISTCSDNFNMAPVERDLKDNAKLARRRFINTKSSFMLNTIPNNQNFIGPGTRIKGDFYWTLKIGMNYDPTIYPESWKNQEKPYWYNVKLNGLYRPGNYQDWDRNHLILWDYLRLLKNDIAVNMKDVTMESEPCNWNWKKGSQSQNNSYECNNKNDMTKNPCGWNTWSDEKTGLPCGCGCLNDNQCPSGTKCAIQSYGFGGNCYKP